MQMIKKLIKKNKWGEDLSTFQSLPVRASSQTLNYFIPKGNKNLFVWLARKKDAFKHNSSILIFTQLKDKRISCETENNKEIVSRFKLI